MLVDLPTALRSVGTPLHMPDRSDDALGKDVRRLAVGEMIVRARSARCSGPRRRTLIRVAHRSSCAAGCRRLGTFNVYRSACIGQPYIRPVDSGLGGVECGCHRIDGLVCGLAGEVRVEICGDTSAGVP